MNFETSQSVKLELIVVKKNLQLPIKLFKDKLFKGLVYLGYLFILQEFLESKELST